MSPELTAGTVIDMTPDEALTALDELRAARVAGKAAEDATPGAVVEALKTGVTAAEIARRIGLSEGYVRKFRRQAGLQDKRYAHLKPPVPEEPVSTGETAGRSEAHADIWSLNTATIRRLAALAEEAAPDGWARQVAADTPSKDRPYVIVIAALAEGYLTTSQVPH